MINNIWIISKDTGVKVSWASGWELLLHFRIKQNNFNLLKPKVKYYRKWIFEWNFQRHLRQSAVFYKLKWTDEKLKSSVWKLKIVEVFCLNQKHPKEFKLKPWRRRYRKGQRSQRMHLIVDFNRRSLYFEILNYWFEAIKH